MRKFVPIHIIFSYLALFVVFTSLLLNDTSLASATPQISAGFNHTLALKSDGAVWAWGDNTSGELGNGSSGDNSFLPVQISNLSNIIAISAGGQWNPTTEATEGHSVALKSDGTVWAWGYNGYGQLGDGTTVNRPTPVQVSGISDIIAIACGYGHTMALKSDGTVWAWGLNDEGQLGDGTTTNRTIPVQVSSLSDVIAIECGGYHSLALKSDGMVWVWGYNGNGELGDGTTVNRYTPTQVTGINNVIAVAGGQYHSIALKSDGTIWAWGINWFGLLGDGTTTNRKTPVQVGELSDVSAIAGGGYHTIALKSDGTVWTWGRNDKGQLGEPTTDERATPGQVSEFSDCTDIDGGGEFTIALKSDGTVWGWGANWSGQLGNGKTGNRSSPVQVKNLNLGQTTTSTPTPTVTASPTPTPSSTTTPPTSWVTNPSNGHRYKLTYYSGTWEECESDAVYEGAHLVTINDEDEQNWLIATFGGDESYFIGFTDKNKERYWEWISGEEVTYTNWSDGQPDNYDHGSERENYAEMNYESPEGIYPGKWNDTPGSNGLRAIIEKVNDGQTPTPSPTPKATPTPTPADGTGVIYGFVLDENEFAFKNVSVTLTYTNGYSKSAKTDSEGYYEFVNLAAGDYTLTYSKNGYQTQTQDVSLEEDESLDIGTITMEPVEKGMISGYVVNIRGDPIEYVKLKLKGIKTKKTKTTVSDADGFFEFTDLDADDYIITAKRSRYKSTRKTIQLEEGDEVEIEIELKKTSRRGIMVLDQ